MQLLNKKQIPALLKTLEMLAQASVKTQFCLLFLGLFLRNYLFKMLREATWPFIQYFSGNNRHFSSGLTVLQLTMFLYKHVGTLSDSSGGPLDHRICCFNSNKHSHSSKGRVKSRLCIHRGVDEFPGVSREFLTCNIKNYNEQENYMNLPRLPKKVVFSHICNILDNSSSN